MSTASASDAVVIPPYRCADAARLRDDPIVGTAPPARRWLLLEHPGPWRVDALAGLPMSPAVRHTLLHAAAHAHARILLIRRPGRDRFGVQRRWYVVDEDGGTVTGGWHSEDDLLTAAAAVEAPAPTGGDREPFLLVCAHGVHDVCCAIRGRPVAEALAGRWPERVWEVSHVGGCRFAPTVVVLPDGFYYGDLDGDAAVPTIQRHLAGDVATEHLRGIARFAPPAQAAVVEAYRRLGPLAPGAVHVAMPTGIPHGETTVDLEVAGRPEVYRAVVRAEQRPPAQLTCRAGRETSATQYELLSFEAQRV